LTQKLTQQILVKAMSLTDAECRKAQPKDKQYHLSDSHGLSLLVITVGKNGMCVIPLMVSTNQSQLANIHNKFKEMRGTLHNSLA
jgi:hypothetical protein